MERTKYFVSTKCWCVLIVSVLCYIPKNDHTIFSAASGMFPSSRSKCSVNRGTGLRSSEPCVYNNTGTGIKLVGLRREVDVVDGVEEGRGRNLRCLGTPSSGVSLNLRGRREH